MSITVIKSNVYKTGIVHDRSEVFVLDSEADLALLPADTHPGSIAWLADMSASFELSPSGEWMESKIVEGSGGMSGGGGGVTWLTTATTTARKWNPSTESYEKLSEQEFKTAFNTGIIRVDGSGIYPGYSAAASTVVGYQINDEYKVIRMSDNTEYRPINW